jgi:hypothetical protein
MIRCKVFRHRYEKHLIGQEAWGGALFDLVCRRCGKTLKAKSSRTRISA